MRYQVICTKCKRPFAIEVNGEQMVQCVCPYCGMELAVNIPDAQPPGNTNRQTGDNGWMKTLVVVLMGLAIVLGIAAWIYYDYVSTQERRIEEERKEAAYRLHYDSLMQQRERQAAEWAEPIAAPEDEELPSDQDEITEETNQEIYEANKDSL